MYEDIRLSKDFEYEVSRRGAKAVLLLNRLLGIPYDKAISMILFLEFGALLRHGETKAWFSL